MIVQCDLSEKGNRIEVQFNYDDEYLEIAKSVPGHSFVKKGRNGEPASRYPLDTQTARRLREAFGDELKLTPRLRKWGRERTAYESKLAAMALADTAELERLPKVLPKLYKMTADRPYQRADIALMSMANVLNGNQTGLGKTIELIGATYEAGLEDGPKLISAPATALVSTWQVELEAVQGQPVLTGETVEEREAAINQAHRWAKRGKPFWLVLNPEMIRYERDRKSKMISRRGKLGYPTRPRYPELFEISWNIFGIDEAHKTGVANPQTLMYEAVGDMSIVRLWYMTATPMGGKPIKMWGYFSRLDPATFTSKWAWAERWIEMDVEEFWTKEGPEERTSISHRIIPNKEDEFVQEHQHILLRRRRRDVWEHLPPEEHMQVLCSMTDRQKRMYLSFAAQAEIRIEEERLSATNILAEYTRLKQFANAVCRVEKKTKVNRATGETEERLLVFPTEDSGKLQFLLDRLDENGIRPKNEDPEPGAQAIVGSESAPMCDMVCAWLNKKGVKAKVITGATKMKERTPIIKQFKRGRFPVLVLSTRAGGTSLNLENIGSAHILDETWDPDDQDQFWGRGDRGTRVDSLLVYWYRTQDTIQEYINEVASGKAVTNKNILDIRREMLAVQADKN